jgi:hypothetical protein
MELILRMLPILNDSAEGASCAATGSPLAGAPESE